MNNPNPRVEFLKLPAAKQWADVTASDAYALAVTFALAEFANSVVSSDAQQLAGARSFVKILSSMGTPAEPPDRSLGQLRPTNPK